MFTSGRLHVNIAAGANGFRGGKMETIMPTRVFFCAAIAAFGLSACVTPAAEQAGADAGPATLAKADPRLGPEVERICFQRSINGWSTIDGDDDAIILRRSVRDDYRVEYTGPCRGSDFRFAETIGIAGRPAGGCLTRGDRLLVEGPGDFVNRCLITQINEWDEDAVDGEDAVQAEDDEG